MKSDNAAAGSSQPGAEAFTTPEGMTIDQRIYRKTLTMGTVNAMPERAKMARRTVLLCRFAGIVHGVEDQTSPKNNEVFTALVGQFECDVYEDDGAIRSYFGGYCYLPGGFQQAVLSRFQQACDEAAKSAERMNTDRETEPATAEVVFNLEFAAEPAANPIGYSYVARNVDPIPVRVDRLAQMRSNAKLVAHHRDAPQLEERRPAIEHRAS